MRPSQRRLAPREDARQADDDSANACKGHGPTTFLYEKARRESTSIILLGRHFAVGRSDLVSARSKAQVLQLPIRAKIFYASPKKIKKKGKKKVLLTKATKATKATKSC